MSASLVPIRLAARQLSVSPDTVRRLIRRGELRSVRIGKSVRIPSDDLDRLTEHGTTAKGVP